MPSDRVGESHTDPWTHGFVTANGIDVHFVEAGTGPLLLLLHGFPEFWYSWRHQIPGLARHFHVVAPDRRGINETTKPSDGYDVRNLVEDTVSLASSLGAESFSLAGHDWGGVIAWATAARYPDRVERLSILNAPHPTLFAHALRSSPSQMKKSWYILAFQVRGLAERRIRRDVYAFLERVMRGQMVHPERLTDHDLRQFEAAIARPGALEAALEYYRQAFRSAVRDRMFVHDVPVRVPTQVIWGERDHALAIDQLDGLERLVPGVRIDRIASASHWVQQDEPDLVTDLMIDFLDNAHPVN